jgi:hypothetical protein
VHQLKDDERRAVVLRLLGEEAERIKHDRDASWSPANGNAHGSLRT